MGSVAKQLKSEFGIDIRFCEPPVSGAEAATWLKKLRAGSRVHASAVLEFAAHANDVKESRVVERGRTAKDTFYEVTRQTHNDGRISFRQEGE